MSLLQANLAGLGGSGAPGGALAGGDVYSHELNQSLRFNDDDSAQLSRTPSSAGNQRTWTWSSWVKRSTLGATQTIFSGGTGSTLSVDIAFGSSDNLQMLDTNNTYLFITTAVFRDTSAWYHIVVECDTTQSPVNERTKLYVNGEQITSFSTDNRSNFAEDEDTAINSTNIHYIGRWINGGQQFDGYMAEINFIDGTALDADNFGETVDGVWVPKQYSGSYGTNGFYLPFTQSDSAGFSTFFHTKNTSKITHSDASSFDIGSSDDFTVEFFFNIDGVGRSGTDGYGHFMGTYATLGPHFLIQYDFQGTNRKIYWYTGNGAAFQWNIGTDVTVKPNKWHHIAFQRDGTTLRAYIDGTRLTDIVDAASNTGYTLSSGKATDFNKAYDLSQMILSQLGQGMRGYLSNVRFVIGNTVYADDDNDITVPTGTLTAVTGTKLLTCHNATVGDDASTENNDGSVTSAVASTVGPFSTSNYFQDASGQENHFQPSANLRTTDVVLDSPTNNFPTWNSLQPQGAAQGTNTLSEVNLKAGNSANKYGQSMGSMSVLAGKWYTETYINDAGYPSWHIGWTYGSRFEAFDGGTNSDEFFAGFGYFTGSNVYFSSFGETYAALQKAYSGIHTAADAPTTGDVISCAADFDNGKFWWAINGEWLDVGSGAGDPANDSNPARTFTVATYADKYKSPWVMNYNGSFILNAGQDGTFAGNITAGGNSDENGHGNFKYSVPSGFLALCSSNLPDPTIGPGENEQADDYFETMLYTGNGSGQSIGSSGVQHPQDTTTIANSVRFEDGDNNYLTKSDQGTSSSNKQFTFSCWVKRGNVGSYNTILGTPEGGDREYFGFLDTNEFIYQINNGTNLISNRKFLNTSGWYHVVVAVNINESTDSDRQKIYINGEQITSFSSANYYGSSDTVNFMKSGVATFIGRLNTTYTNSFDGYMAEINFIDGSTLDPTYFGQVGANGYWIPKALSGLTYGTNGFRLTFENSSYLGYDYQTSGRSGTTNDFTVSGLVATDQVIDSPTQNFSTMNPNRYSGIGTFSQGNLTVATTTNNRATYGTIAVPSSGKWYYEVRVDSYASGGGAQMGWGTDVSLGDNETSQSKGIFFSTYNEQVTLDNSGQSGGYGSTGTNVASNGDVYSILLDVDNGLFYYDKNGTYFNSANPSSGTGGLSVGNIIAGATTEIRPSFTRGGSYNETYTANFGQDPSFNGGETAPGTDKTDANGVGKFLYDVPTGFLALMDDNIPQEGIASPDFVWIKKRNGAASHYFFDTVRGATKNLHSDSTNAEATDTDSLLSFDKQGFTVGSNGDVNGSADTYVAWTWKAGGISPTQTYTVKVVSDSGNKYRFDDFGTSAITLSLQEGGTYTFDQSDSSNSGHPLRFSTTSDGTHNSGSEYTVGVTTSGTPGSSGAKTVITVAHGAPTLYYYCSSHSGMGGQANTTTTHGSTNLKGSIQSVVSANQDAGFSILSWTGDGNSGATVGHDLSQTPEVIWVKNRDTTDIWTTVHPALSADHVIYLHLANAQNSSAASFGTHTNQVIGVDTDFATNKSGSKMIAYCFHSVEGYSKVGSYTGNGNADGTFVYTGFRPAWVMIKKSSGTDGWSIYDSAREPINVMDTRLSANLNNAEVSGSNIELDYLSNGFKLKGTGTTINSSGATYVYLAFAEAPFKYANAR